MSMLDSPLWLKEINSERNNLVKRGCWTLPEMVVLKRVLAGCCTATRDSKDALLSGFGVVDFHVRLGCGR